MPSKKPITLNQDGTFELIQQVDVIDQNTLPYEQDQSKERTLIQKLILQLTNMGITFTDDEINNELNYIK